MKALDQIIEHAEKGDADAQFILGSFYDEGFGLGRDHSESVRWLKMAAAQGHAAAQCSIGYNYAVGHGAPQDYVLAREWLRAAADKNFAKAQFNLGLMCFNGLGAPRDCAEAAMWLQKAADQSHADAQVLLGSLFIDGAGVAKDYAEASRWLQKAAEQGHTGAETVLKHLSVNNLSALAPARTEVEAGVDARPDGEVGFLNERDAVTGILNRTAMLQALQAEINRVRAREHVMTGGLALIFIGLGELPSSSNGTGPTCQDAVLCGLSDRLAENLRRSDSLGRMGREEFAVCAPGATLPNATALAQRLHKAVAAELFDTPAGPAAVTVHIGVAAFQAGDSVASLVDRAQASMSSARQAHADKLVPFDALPPRRRY
ncbi:diguanylate cyclase domain-containing protein [Methylocapsa palsarum]|uniref:Diguanylate cyclase (GGDEF) domain-containing protein n=1 Tax=Methylocapsa palsarum TaxID=1612308 RepID=A0A1I3Y0B4_9HYPH|nr:diguanylate cyclase [Methylocapsa palsarum]SFK25235.1 diguanylate cyclase (GGDEF) domain-containing protein [Methylocapsa palsarum]